MLWSQRACAQVCPQRDTLCLVVRAENVDVLAVSDRYEGHTADLLFTKWLSTTEAALSPEPQAPGAVATPGMYLSTHTLKSAPQAAF